MQRRSFWKRACVVPAVCTLAAAAAQAQTFAILAQFDDENGSTPNGPLVQGADGNLYGTTMLGGAGAYGGQGTIFKVTRDGALTTLYSFCAQTAGAPQVGQGDCREGAQPNALVLDAGGNFYGTASHGGALRYGGTIFTVFPSAGAPVTLHRFCADVESCPVGGEGPTVGLVLGADGNFYGTTSQGGANNVGGTIFKITPRGALTTLYNFCSHPNCTDGEFPDAALIQGIDGNFYGTTRFGGASGNGTIFRITPGGKLTTLYSFDILGNDILGALVQDRDGNFNGTTSAGGTYLGGTIFRITPQGAFRTIYDFCEGKTCPDGEMPAAGLILGTDGSLYGVTTGGGANGHGTVFKITADGNLTTLYNFTAADGYGSGGELLQGTDGSFYGTTCCGVNTNHGIVFRLSAGLEPFVKTVPVAGRAGTGVSILGTDLTGTTSVAFNRTPAEFTVVSPTEIKAAVPAGATTGSVQVTTPGGTLASNVAFQVGP